MKRIAALILMLVLLLPALPAQAEKTVYANYNIVKVYARKSEDSNLLYKLSYGESVTCANYRDGGRGMVKVVNEKGHAGYCEMAQLTDKDPNTLNFTALTQKGAKMHVLPRKKSMVMAEFSKDVTIKVVALTHDGKWFRVKKSGHYGYVLTGDIRPLHKVWFVGENTGLTDNNGNGENLISYGESLQIYGITGKRAVAKFGGRVGYIWNYDADDFSAVNPCKAGKTLYIMANGVRMSSEAAAGTSAYVQFKLNKNDKVTFYGSAPGVKFCRVKYNGKFGYILKSLVSEEKIRGDVIVTAKDDISIYKEKIGASAVVGTADKGDELILLNAKVNRVKVTVKETGVTGWIKITEFK